MSTNESTNEARRAALLAVARRLTPAIVEIVVEVCLETGRDPSEAMVTEAILEYQRQCDAMVTDYLSETDTRADVREYVLGRVWAAVRARHGA